MTWPLPNRVCSVLGIQVPVVQSGMAGVAGPELAAEVSNAGGLGILAGHGVPLDELQVAVAKLRSLTDRPFGVNLLIPADVSHPATVDSISSSDADRVQTALNEARRDLGIEERRGVPNEPSPYLQQKLEWLIEDTVPVLSFGLGNPGPLTLERCRRAGTRTIAMVATSMDAKAVEDAGIDIVVAQGSEAGGHRSHFVKPSDHRVGLVGTMALVPEVVDAVSIPVLAAGGIADGRGFAAALMLGAEGILVGTRFVGTKESMVRPAYKEALMAAQGSDTCVTDSFSGRYARVIRNRMLEEYERSGAPVLPFLWQGAAFADVLDAARAADRGDRMALWAGQSTGLIHDLPTAKQVVYRFVDEALELLAKMSPM
jgi:nitronate monooxygenase